MLMPLCNRCASVIFKLPDGRYQCTNTKCNHVQGSGEVMEGKDRIESTNNSTTSTSKEIQG